MRFLKKWDFFIAHASSDLPIAEKLYEYLKPCSVFLDSRNVEPGDDWDIQISSAQEMSTITVVLVSEKTNASYYERAEIATAISLARKDPDNYRVVPIFFSNNVTYGLNIKQGIKISDKVTIKDAADILIKLLYEKVSEDEGRAPIYYIVDESEECASDVMLNVSAYNDENQPPFYITNYEKNIIKINSNQPYVSIYNNGGPINAYYYDMQPFNWDYPNLDIKVVNNSNKTIFFTDIVLDIKESILDPSPVLIINNSIRNTHIPMKIELNNQGWGKARDLKARFRLIPSDSTDYNFSGPYPYEIFVGDIDSYGWIYFSEAFKKEGVDVEKFLELYSKRHTYENYESEKQLYLGKFKKECAVALGEFEFYGDTLTEKNKLFNIKFKTIVYLLMFECSAEFKDFSYQYPTTKIKYDGKNYQVRVPISQVLKPQEADRFNLKIGVDKSSLHKFQLKLLYNNNMEVKSPEIELRAFIPRTRSNYFREKSDEIRNIINSRD